MHRFFVSPDAPNRITGDEFTHLTRVLRLKTGEEIEVMDGVTRYAAIIERLDKHQALIEIKGTLPSREPQIRLTLYPGIVRMEKLEFMVQKATELGAHAIVPLRMARSTVRLNGENGLNRLNRIAKEAVKQCGRSYAPLVEAPLDFQDALERMKAHDRLLMPYEGGGQPFSLLDAKDIGLLIGPEGGIAPEEAQAIVNLGGTPLTLGIRILRAETAAIAALTLTMAMAGELGGAK